MAPPEAASTEPELAATPLHCTGHTEAAHTHQHCTTLILRLTKLAITQTSTFTGSRCLLSS